MNFKILREPGYFFFLLNQQYTVNETMLSVWWQKQQPFLVLFKKVCLLSHLYIGLML